MTWGSDIDVSSVAHVFLDYFEQWIDEEGMYEGPMRHCMCS